MRLDPVSERLHDLDHIGSQPQQRPHIIHAGVHPALHRPGGLHDGIDKGGGEQPSELNKVFDDRQKSVKTMMEAFDVEVTTATANSDCCSITTGYRFNLVKHPNGSDNKQYVILTATHESEQNPSYVSNEGSVQPYTNSFTFAPNTGL